MKEGEESSDGSQDGDVVIPGAARSEVESAIQTQEKKETQRDKPAFFPVSEGSRRHRECECQEQEGADGTKTSRGQK